MTHHVDNLVVSCVDFRFRPLVAKWIDEQLNGKADLISLAGASKAVADDDTRATALKQFGICDRLHGVKTIHIVDHIDCGAYGGSSHYDSTSAELADHQQKLAQAIQAIKTECPNAEIKTYLAQFNAIAPFAVEQAGSPVAA